MGAHSPIQRCLDLLELLAEAPEGLALAALAARLRLPKSAVHRVLALLAARGFVRQDEATQHYALTLKLPSLGLRFLAGTGVSDLAQPVLDQLASRTHELARLAIVDGDGLVWCAKAQGAGAGLRYDADTARRVILHVTATGKIWLSTLPEAHAIDIVRREGRIGGPGVGPCAIRTLAALRRDLRETRRRGYGVAIEEGESGVAAIAVVVHPQRDTSKPACATVSIAGPLARMGAARRAELACEARASADAIADLWPVKRAAAKAA